MARSELGMVESGEKYFTKPVLKRAETIKKRKTGSPGEGSNNKQYGAWRREHFGRQSHRHHKIWGICVPGENKSGLVHISEIANTYVNDIHEHLQEGQAVKVKVLAIDENGRINLSIKRALPNPGQGQGGVRGVQGGRGAAHRSAGSAQRPGFTRGGARVAAPAVPMTAEESFEAKLKSLHDGIGGKISDLNHSMDKRGRRR